MGLEARAHALKTASAASPTCDIDAAVERLAGPSEMGELFKVIAVTTPGLGRPYPFVDPIT
jgi:NADH dehydrogenase [ubiquinone] 1 alpha subcomplex assembly factor 7